ncbi:hypothetical protein L1987_12144 [Smallanthus sonchifolius]|uniref:Uncharacterized protein n=1 Tax=Smallanthus sonchifolius TaxID=185202 RepID=A0ACB9JDE5_9ASTR|nr:hypothetical protein L1987_12144 [Smallanthus sonchifolius]
MQASKEHLRHIWSCSDMLFSLGSWRPDIWHATWIWMTMFFTQKKLYNEVKELDKRLGQKGFSKLQQTPLNILGRGLVKVLKDVANSTYTP